MIGIYKITNLVNQHSYIGQSKDIETRWKRHKRTANNKNDKSYNYPLYKAIRKYGENNFSYEILEECSIEQLNEREIYWINFYHSEYNQTLGGNQASIPQKLTPLQVKEIQNTLINDKEGIISHKELGELYGVSGKDTIRDINVGRTWFDPTLIYPLHYSKFDNRFMEEKLYKGNSVCISCGKRISYGSNYCAECFYLSQRKAERPDREELKKLIRTLPFTAIGKMYNVTDNAIRKWCIAEKLPSKKSDIKKYSEEEWKSI